MTASGTSKAVRTATCLGTALALSCGYNQGGKDRYMPRDSVGAEDGDCCGSIQGGKDCYMPRDSVGTEDGDSCGYI